MDLIAQLEFELTNYHVAAQYVSLPIKAVFLYQIYLLNLSLKCRIRRTENF